MDYIDYFNRRISGIFMQAFWLSLRKPAMIKFLVGTIRHQQASARRREQWRAEGLDVPPVMIVSITHQCNLRCTGCYAHLFKRNGHKELSRSRFETLLSESSELGISTIFLAGGEPLLRKDILEVSSQYPGIMFPFFTNGTLIDEQWISVFNRQKNLMPVISLEGHREQTDARRGEGVHDSFIRNVAKMKNQRFFWGVSFTLTRRNYSTVLDPSFLSTLIKDGCSLFFFIEYVPVEAGTEDLTITEVQRKQLVPTLNHLREELPGLFFAFPGDEEQYGGCLAAGRGFIHINPLGNVEPCPFAPYSDSNINEMSLREALSSELLMTIRNNHHMLTETAGGCALWQNKEWLEKNLAHQAVA